MALYQPTNTAIPNRYAIPLLLSLVAAGLAGNYFKFTIFFNVDFVFGSIFAMLALQFFGLRRGILAAAMIAGYTYILWNHPYAIIIMTGEVAFVGWLMGRSKMGLIQADVLYWLIIGMPLVYFFYHVIMQSPFSNTHIIMVKQAVNGVANALIARLIYIGYSHRSRTLLVSYREIIYNLLAFFVLCPVLIMMGIGSRTDFNELVRQISTSLILDSQSVDQRLETWLGNRKSAIVTLAEMAASRSPQQMQSYLELAKKSDVNFEQIGLQNRDASTTAIFPLVDELGQNSIVKNFTDRPVITALRRTLKPMLSEVVMDRVLMLAPVVIRGEYSGYVAGILSLKQIREHLDKSIGENASLYTLIDNNGNVIMTNRTDQTVMTPFVRGKGTVKRYDNGISRWHPTVPPNTLLSERWQKSFYFTETTIGNLSEWKLVMEQPVAPFLKVLYDKYTGQLTLLSLILFLSLVLAEFISRMFVVTLGKLRALTYELPFRMATDGKEIAWPESGIKETNHLINNFRQMSDSLSDKFIEVRQINELLEHRVQERTAQLDIINAELTDEIAERKQAEEALRKSEELYHSLVETSQDLIWQCDTEGTYTFLNLAWEQVFDYELDEMLGKKFTEFQTPEYAARDMKGFTQLMQGESADHYETMHIGKSGNKIHLVISALFMCDQNGDIVGASGTAYDITQRKLMEEELCRSNIAAESANIAKSHFLATMSHEIRTPMNGIIGMIELLQHSKLTAEQYEFAEIAKKSGFELVRLLNDILDLSKIEADKIELETSVFDLRQVISDTISLLSLPAREKGVKLTSEIDDEVPIVLKGDSGRLRQIIINLVGNAIKFTPEGSVTLNIYKDIEDEQFATLRFLVRDNGIGIAADKLEHIFKPFTQADGSTTRKYGGTGLGLTISRQLVELMGGSVGLVSAEGQGSTFWFTVIMEKQTYVPSPPLNPDPLDDGTKASLKREEIGGKGGIRILLTEDDPNAQKILPKLLKSYGYQVDVAGDGKEALLALENNDYSLVLMDCMMPEMNGYEVTAVIRDPASAVRRHNIPVIALTGNAMKQDRDRCIVAGMNDHLPKPLLLPDLLAMLEKWLNV